MKIGMSYQTTTLMDYAYRFNFINVSDTSSLIRFQEDFQCKKLKLTQNKEISMYINSFSPLFLFILKEKT